MPTWVKVTLVVVLVGFVALAAGIVVAARWVKTRGTQYGQEARDAYAQGEEFGRGKDARACMQEALRRVRACESFLCETTVNVFAQNCLQVADVTPESCTGVARPGDLIDSARWQQLECKRLGAGNDARCIRLVGVLQVRCSEL